MGSWFAAFLKKNGYEVKVCDRNRRAAQKLARERGLQLARNLNEAASAELIILATPTRVTKNLLERVSRLSRPKSLIVEISSVKTPLRRAIVKLRREAVPILSIHPMFGPGAKSIAGRTVITVSVPRNHVAKQFLSTLRRRGARLIPCELNDHDKLASTILALPHFMNIVLVNTLTSLSTDPNRLLALAGTTFKLQLLLAEAIFQEDVENEISILVDNIHSRRILRRLLDETKSTLNAVNSGDGRTLSRMLKDGHAFVRREKFFSTSYKRFNDAVEMSSRR
jgi:prephenate dehydrogenase